jgi:ABC-type multidrug transport system fused ATPase/permease subunit
MILNKIYKIRKLESSFNFRLFQMRGTYLILGLIDIFTQIMTQIISLVVFSVYVAQGNDFNPSIAFTLIALFNILQTPTRMICVSWNSYKNAMVSLARIQTFIDLPEKQKTFVNLFILGRSSIGSRLSEICECKFQLVRKRSPSLFKR